MKIQNINDVEKFFQVIDSCAGKVELVTGEEDIPDEKFQPLKKCEKCGCELNDAGECPVCDLGDESVLREDLIVVAPNEGKEKLGTLKHLIENEDNENFLKPKNKKQQKLRKK